MLLCTLPHARQPPQTGKTTDMWARCGLCVWPQALRGEVATWWRSVPTRGLTDIGRVRGHTQAFEGQAIAKQVVHQALQVLG